ncbi:RNA 2'-phosphotransferase [Chryseobacterium lactis]|uniref:Probable RNA 2'-phosphotransferase n=1 Tax=Chryseobacterium lactis TaxID=1241981 RepID=A0A3G6RSR9_CHRLC|nr:RNA 2'-phosphotransferase [Chryseobacterium lactis]AZA81340.1 RNA 2'-phosphotransferase [Chryseobacterium lactis]AZB06339.1 RNA 2'-phosphotransferase [Chryseobacterium lactis]PNW15192.1 RNA 2'-phosphotransferase [Chryseobacterium lactis]
MNEIEKKKISKFLSLILRHQPESIGLKLDESGWANVEELKTKSAQKRIYFTTEELDEVVETNNKKRFAFNEDKTMIRASQGHSIDIDLAIEAQQPPEFLYHGTAESNISSILDQGIQKRNRQHVHLSADKETATKVGMRHGKPVILTIRTGKMYEDGLSFYLSANEVWLTDFVDAKYISK